MQLSTNQKLFAEIFSSFPEFKPKLDYFEKKDEPRRLFVSEIIHCKKRGYLNTQKAAHQNTYRQSTC